MLIRKARSLEELKTVAKILGYKEGWAYQMNSVRRYRKNKNISADQLGWI